MRRSNYHSHCTFCDGRSFPEDFIRHAISKGMQTYGFSSHAPLPFETYWTMNREDMSEYFQEIDRLKLKHKDQIEIYAGLETDYLNISHNAAIEYFANLPTDYLICSIHYIPDPATGELMTIDGSFEEFAKDVKRLFNNKIEEVILAFFRQSNEMVKLGGFDIVGHVDKIYYNGGKLPGFYDHQNLIDEQIDILFKTIAEKGLYLEINTKSFHNLGFTYPHQRYFDRIRELKIPIIINCDSHYPDHVMQGKVEVANLLTQCGFTHTMELIGGKWQEYPLM